MNLCFSLGKLPTEQFSYMVLTFNLPLFYLKYNTNTSIKCTEKCIKIINIVGLT